MSNGSIHDFRSVKKRSYSSSQGYNTEQNKYNVSTVTPTYWPPDPQKIPDLLDFFITQGLSESYLEIKTNYDLSSDHSPIIATVSESIITKPPPPHLHIRKTKWEKYREFIHQGVDLNMRLKTSNDIETATNAFITLLQDAARQATPPLTKDVHLISIPVELKQLLAKKRKACARRHRTHSPDDKRIFYWLSHKLKTQLKEARERSTQKYIARLSTQDNSLWKPLGTAKRPITAMSRPILGRLLPCPPARKTGLFPLLTVPLRLSSDHWLFSQKIKRQGHAPSFPFKF